MNLLEQKPKSPSASITPLLKEEVVKLPDETWLKDLCYVGAKNRSAEDTVQMRLVREVYLQDPSGLGHREVTYLVDNILRHTTVRTLGDLREIPEKQLTDAKVAGPERKQILEALRTRG